MSLPYVASGALVGASTRVREARSCSAASGYGGVR